MPEKHQQGIVDFASLAVLAFFVVSILVSTVVISNPNTNLDIRKRAREIKDDTLGSIIKTSTPTPTKTPVATNPPIPAKTSTSAPQKSSESNKIETQDSTSETNILETTPTTQPELKQPTPEPTPYCSTVNQENCPYGCEPSLAGGTCSVRIPTPTPTPAPTAPPTKENLAYLDCLTRNTPSECSGTILKSPIPITQQTPAFCSPFMVRDCLFGCEPTPTGGVCKDRGDVALSPPSTSIWDIAAQIPRRPLFENCSFDFQCESNYCNQSNGKCSINPSQTAGDIAMIAKDFSSEIIPPAFIQTHLAQIEANPEFSSLAALNPTYNLRLLAYNLQFARNPEDFVGSAVSSMFSYMLSTLADDIDVLGGIDYGNRFQRGVVAPYALADILTLGGLTSVTQAATSYASAYANAPEGATFLNNPELFFATVNAGIQGTGVAFSLVSPFTGGVPTQALQEMYQLRQGVQSKITGMLDEAASILRLPGANNPADWTLGTYGNQTIISYMPEGMSPSEQLVWISQERINTGRLSHPEHFTGPKYSAQTATMAYDPTDIASFIQTLPEDVFWIDVERIIAQNSNNPEAALREVATLVENSPGLEITINRDPTMKWYQRGAVSSHRPVHIHPPPESLTSLYDSVNIQQDWYMHVIDESEPIVSGWRIRTNPTLTPYQELKALIHEFGHITEEILRLPRLIQLPDLTYPIRITTESVSTAYAVRFSQIMVENGLPMNLAVDLATDQLELFNMIMFGLASR